MAQNICCEDSVPTEDCSQSQATIEKMPRLTLSAARPSLSANPATQSWRAPSTPQMTRRCDEHDKQSIPDSSCV
jgi:hypothetical protein